MLAVGPQLVSIVRDTVDPLTDNQIIQVAPNELRFRFTSAIDASTLVVDGVPNIQITRGGDHILGNGNDVTVNVPHIALGTRSDDVILRFDSLLPDDLYHIRIVGAGGNPLRNVSGDAFNDGADLTRTFTLDLGALVVGVVPQPITRNPSTGVLSQATRQIDVYFNVNDPLNVSSAQTTAFYQLIRTAGTANTTDDVVINPESIAYDQSTGKAVLTFPVGTLTVAGAYRLRIGNREPLALAPVMLSATPGDTFTTAAPLGAGGQPFTQPLGTQTVQVSGTITNVPTPVIFPGSPIEPGERDPSIETRLSGGSNNGPILIQPYNFQSQLGTVLGQPSFNLISEAQKSRVREVLSYYSHYMGVQFVETPSSGFIIATGDVRVLAPDGPPTGIGGIAGGGKAIMNSQVDWGASEPGGSYFTTAMHEIGHLLGLGHNYAAPAVTVQGNSAESALGASLTAGEPVFPGDLDLIYGKYLWPALGNDIDVYRFSLAQAGRLNLETIAERLRSSGLASVPSQLDSVITLFDAAGNIIARNDNYFGKDAFIQLQLGAGSYFVAITSTGNTDFDPRVPNSGFGGTSQGDYTLRMTFTPNVSAADSIRDQTGRRLDGDADGLEGGVHNFWFKLDASKTIFVDKAAPGGAGPLGSLTNPYKTISGAMAAISAGSIVRIVGNGGADGDLATIEDNLSYNIGFNSLNQALSDGSKLEIPKNVTVMVDAGAIIKLRGTNIDVGSSAQGIDRSNGALQVLGTPARDALGRDVGSVYFTSYYDSSIGTDPGTAKGVLAKGNWGGLVFRDDSDLESAGIFVNYVNQARISYGGGQVSVNSVLSAYAPIHLETARPTITYNTITNSADSAISGNPNSFEESEFFGPQFHAEYARVGPRVYGNMLAGNSINGLFVRIRTLNGSPLDPLTVNARFVNTDMVHVLHEVLLINGDPGGMFLDSSGMLKSRPNARLAIDPGIVMKLGGARIETEIGAQFIAEGTVNRPIIFTSTLDDRWGRSGSSDTTNDGTTSAPAKGNWGGFFFGPTSIGSIDNAFIAYGGGVSAIEGGFDNFDVVEMNQAKVRITNSLFDEHAATGGGDRNGRSQSNAAVIFIRGSQPVLLNNTIQNSNGAAVSVNVNALNSDRVNDWGRSRGLLGLAGSYITSTGPLIRNNLIGNNDLNGMIVRGGTITTNSIWDDTDIVHIVFNSIRTANQQSLTGTLRLQSSPTESLVVKLLGTNVDIVASGMPFDVTDRLGGSLQIVGAPNFPVVLTSLKDDTVGAGLTPQGTPQQDTRNTKGVVDPAPPLLATQGPIILDAAARDVHGSSFGGLDGWDTVAREVNYLVSTSTIQVPAGNERTILAIGQAASQVLGQPYWRDAIEWVAAALNLTVDFAETGSQILGANFANYKMVYIPSHSGYPLPDLRDLPYLDRQWWGGIADFQLDILNTARKNDLLNYVNNQGGGLLVLPQDTAISPAPYAFLAEPDPFILRKSGGNVMTATALAPANWGTEFDINDDNALNIGTPYRAAFVGSTNFNRLEPWAVDPVTGEIAMLGLAAGGPGIGAPRDVVSPADWGTIRLDVLANDRNVEVINELEQGFVSATDPNGTPATAQFLGELAKDHFSGDDNVRLGFEIHGAISQAVDSPGRADVDVYSFRGTAGYWVWLDIDRTSPSLDSVVELVDANGAVIARSDNSVQETFDRSLLVGSAQPLQVGSVPTTISPLSTRDFYSSNPKDAGMRVVLPGTAGTVNTYFVRVRSSSGNLADLAGGVTKGAYALQLRLQEVDEFPGSTVRYADIRYANNGIEVIGKPDRTPLVSDTVEFNTPNNFFGLPISGVPVPGSTAAATDLGNLLESDQAALTVGGNLANSAQVDWYKFDLNAEHIQSIGGFNDFLNTFAATLRIHYADGLVRPDTTISLYDSSGTLVLIAQDSQVVDALPRPNTGSDMANLAHGSFGVMDPTLGPVQLPRGNPVGTNGEGRVTYYVAVSSAAQLPAALSATFTAAGSSNPLVRLEPVDGIKRISEDRIGFGGFSTAQTPAQLFPGSNGTQLDGFADPYQFGDVVLFVNTQTDTSRHLRMVNPLTGALLNTTLNAPSLQVTTGSAIGYFDIAMRNDGRLFAFSQGDNDNGSGNYTEFNTATGAAVNTDIRLDDGLSTFRFGDNTEIADDPADPDEFTLEDNGLGVQFEALAFLNIPASGGRVTRRLFAIGNRDNGAGGEGELTEINNLMFEFNPETGEVIRGEFEGEVFNEQVNKVADVRTATDARPIATFSNLSGNVTGMAFLNNVLYLVTDDGFVYSVTDFDDENDISLSQLGAQHVGVNFRGLTVGPANVEGGAYGNVLFAIDSSGVLRAIHTDGSAAPVFLHGQSSIATGVPNPEGLAFSTLDYNLWHTTVTRATDDGHGINESFNNNRLRTTAATASQLLIGGGSFYFGLEGVPAANPLGTVAQPGAAIYASDNPDLLNTYGLPGGAYGSITSNSFSLEGYTSFDLPTLYFNYFLDTNDNDRDLSGSIRAEDVMRVMISADGVNWQPLATSNVVLNSGNAENPRVLTPQGGVYRGLPEKQRIQGLFESDASGDPVWRQARVDLGDFAGRSNLQLRFQFSTAGSMGSGNSMRGTGSTIRALPGAELRDGQSFNIGGTEFTFRSGFSLNVPTGGGAVIADGETLTIDGITYEFNKSGGVSGLNTPINITDQQSAEQVAQAIVAVLPSPGALPTKLLGARIEMPSAAAISQSASPAIVVQGSALPAIPAATDVVIDGFMTSTQVAREMAVSIDAALTTGVDDPNIFTSSKLDGDILHIYGHSIFSSGPLPSFSGILPGDDYGNFISSTRDRHLGTFEGVYIDDIIVGFASRGEMVTGALAGDTSFATIPAIPNAPTRVLFGDYQLQISPTDSYAFGLQDDDGHILLTRSFDVNDRFATGFTLVAPAGSQIYDGQTFTIDDGSMHLVFEFDTNGQLSNAAHVQVNVVSGATSAQVASSIRDAINGAVASRGFKVRASTAVSAAGSTGNRVDLFGAFDVLFDTPSSLGVLLFGTSSGVTRSGLGDIINVAAPGQTVIHNTIVRDTRQVGIQVIPVIGQIRETAIAFTVLSIYDVGAPGNTGAVGKLPINNTRGWVPGVTVKNNLVTSIGRTGIQIGGDPNAPFTYSQANDEFADTRFRFPREVKLFVPFVRVVNNTVYDTRNGIASSNASSPTIINNIVANSGVATGPTIRTPGAAIIADTASSSNGTVVGANLYQNNVTNALGVTDSQSIVLDALDPLFVDAANRNFYLAAGSLAIDSSRNSIEERSNLAAILQPIGFALSPIQAPETDLLGQLRVDDPSVPSPPGLGSNVFKDRGALERTDFIGPTAALVNPLDNDSGGVDRNQQVNYVTLLNAQLTDFRIQLLDGFGVGIDDSTVDVTKFAIQRTIGTTTVLLTPDVDYTLAFDTNNKIARLIPADGVWINGIYEITLDNSVAPIKDLAGNLLQANQPPATKFTVELTDTVVSSWQNPVNKYDVNNDGFVHALDALIVINRLLAGLGGVLPPTPVVPPYIDVSGDGILSPLDVLQVINFLNQQQAASLAATPAASTADEEPTADALAATVTHTEDDALTVPSAAFVTDTSSADAIAFSLSMETSLLDHESPAGASFNSTDGSDALAVLPATASGSHAAAIEADVWGSEEWHADDDAWDDIAADLSENLQKDAALA